MTRQTNDNLRRIAEERIDLLLKLARATVKSNASLSKRYVEIAKRIAMRSGVRLGHERKQFICKNCGCLLVPGINCRVRVRSDQTTHVVVTCLGCGARKLYPAVKEKCRRRK